MFFSCFFFERDLCQTCESWGHHVYVFISCKLFIFQRVVSQTRAVGGKELKEDVENSQSPEEKPDATVKATQRCQGWNVGNIPKAWCMLKSRVETGSLQDAQQV